MSQGKDGTPVECCGECRFSTDDGFPVPGLLSCRRYPPTVIGHDGEDRHPVVFANQWCGEFKPQSQAESHPAG